MESISTVSTGQWFMRADRTLGSQPIALEVGVEVSGTRAAAGAGTRELFSERTKTTLVFENGAVVRLSAPVEVGQLLFLKHFESQKEIVARVLRQRSSGSANAAYVELEFTEAVPGFWGELPLLADEEASGPASQELAAAAQFLAEEAAEQEFALPAPKPDHGEVTRLRDEVAGLRMQMSSLLESSAKPAESESRLMPAGAGADEFRAGSENEPFTALDVVRADADPALAAEIAAATPPPGTQRIPYWMLAAGLLIAVLAGAAYFEGFFKNLSGKWQLTADVVSALVSKRGASPVAARPAAVRRPVIKDVATTAAQQSGAALKNGGAETGATADAARGAEIDARNGSPSVEGSQPRDEASTQERVPRPKNQQNRRDPLLRGGDAEFDGAATGADDTFDPPTLIKAVNPVAPPEAVREFVTGDVKCDALIDATGKVASANVISGPPALRAAALEALRLYQYKPATKNGRAVAAHVEATLKFWYEP